MLIDNHKATVLVVEWEGVNQRRARKPARYNNEHLASRNRSDCVIYTLNSFLEPYKGDSVFYLLKLERLGVTISPDGSLTGADNFNVIGVADNPDIRKIWMNHMTEAIKNTISWNEYLGE